MHKVLMITAIAVFVSGCATSSKDITPTYVSPLQYEGYNCRQLAGEEQRLRVRVSELGGRLDQKANRDKLLAATPYTVWFVGGNKDQEAEFSRLTGEMNALQQAAIKRDCTHAQSSP